MTRRARKALTIIAHRGNRGRAPENTLAAFDAAIAAGAEWIELDVQWHAQRLWVFHDYRLERCTNGRGWLGDHTAGALRKLDAGGGERIPFLAEALDRIGGRAKVNIELKTADGTAAAVAKLLRACFDRGWTPDDFLVSSFHHPELREFRVRLPEVPVGIVEAGVPLGLAAAGTVLDARVLSMALEFPEPALVKDARRRGLKVYLYTVNEPDELERARALGADGVFTDFPERFLPSR